MSRPTPTSEPVTAASVLALVQAIERHGPNAPAALAFTAALRRKGIEADAAGGLQVAFLDPQPEPTPAQRLMAVIAADDGDSGTAVCPACKGRLAWARDSHNGHIHAECETPGCLRLMQ